MTPPHEILARARQGDPSVLGSDRASVASAVRHFAQAGDATSALELVALTWRAWLTYDELDEGSSLAAAALNAAGADAVVPWKARALYADGLYAFRAGEADRSRSRNAEALKVARETADLRGECDALTGLARVALRMGDYEEVVRLARQARERAQSFGDRAAEASPLHLEAAGVRLQRDYATARELYLSSLSLNTELGNANVVAIEQHNLGWVELHLGNLAAAEARFRERDSLASADAYGAAWSNLNWAGLAAARGDWEDARRRLAVGKQELEKLSTVLDPDDQFELDWLAAQVPSPKC